MSTLAKVSFENTEIAFAGRDTSELRRALRLFNWFRRRWIVNLGSGLIRLAFNLRLPVKGLVRRTAFQQFCGGETLEECLPAIERLANHQIFTVLDYGMEAGDTEEEFDATAKVKIDLLRFAQRAEAVPAIASKVTALARFGLLEKMDRGEDLTTEELEELQRVKNRLHRICSEAANCDTAIFIDAEESWMQDSVDQLVEGMMRDHNTAKAVVYQTIQLYRTDRLAYLKELHQRASASGFVCAVKLVRGAYMEKERKRARKLGYPSPIHPDKTLVDSDFNEAMRYCLENTDIWFLAGTHNEESSRLLARWVDEKSANRNDPRINTCQLYGMSDQITFNLAQAGFTASKLIPYGPVREVIPYLTRRAQENTSVSGQMGRELHLLRRELRRRANR